MWIESWHRQQAQEMDRLAILICYTQTRRKKLKPHDILGRPLGRRKKRTTQVSED